MTSQRFRVIHSVDWRLALALEYRLAHPCGVRNTVGTKRGITLLSASEFKEVA